MPRNEIQTKTSLARQFDRFLLFLVMLLGLVLGLKYLKQYIYLTFTLLTLKFVWLIFAVLALLTMARKRT